MILNHFYNIFKIILIFKYLILVFFISNTSIAKTENDELLKKITSKLRCMSCQNQTIYSSDAEFSLQIKKIIKEKLENNENEKEILEFLTYRYGEYILFEPKLNKQNIFLWVFPFVILAISLVFLVIRVKKNQ